MLLQRLYTLDTKGKVRFWQAEVDGPRYRVLSGIEGGQEVVGAWVTCTPKNEGRTNATTAEDQALKEARAEYDKKLKRKYHEDRDSVGGAKFFAPMLAEVYSGLAKLKVGEEGVYSQPKLNGVRCIAKADGLWSRTGERIKTAPHIEEAIRPVFNIYPDLVLDGELYNHDYRDDLGTFNGMVSRGRTTPEEAALARRTIQYHVYDAVPRVVRSFSQRDTLRAYALGLVDSPFIASVQTSWAADEAALDALRDGYLKCGYEGQIVRLDKPYEQKRSKCLLKRKEWEDAEFPLVRLEPGAGSWSDAAKRAVLRLPDGRTFGAGIKGSHHFLHGLLYGPTPVQATVKYFALSPDGIPLHPVAVAFHGEMRL